MRKADEEWVQFGRVMEKEVIGNQQKFWMRVKENRRSTRGGTHINNKDGQLLTDQTVRKGVKQGCTLLPWLFNVFMDNVVREARRECIREVVLSTGTVGLLMFADDMVMIAETEEALQHNVEAMNEALVRWDLKVNWKKSKVMRVARKREECQVRIGDEQLEQVDTMKYLGVMISGDGSMQREVEARVGCAPQVIGVLNQAILGRRELNKQTKLKVVNATVMPVLMYTDVKHGQYEKSKSRRFKLHTNECTEEDRGSVLEGLNYK